MHPIFKLAAIFISLISVAAFAYPPMVESESALEADLSFNVELTSYTDSLDLSNTLVKPNNFDQTKKYGVVLVLPTCGGSKGRSENQMRFWIRAMTQAGYLAMNVDSLASRGYQRGNCRPRPVEDGRLLKDAYDAALAVEALPAVDSNRIFTIGFSLGGMTGMLAASPWMSNKVRKGDFRFRANVSVYGGCDYGRGGLYLQNDIDRPLLVLMGAKDTEAPSEQCYWHLEALKSKGVQVAWHTYKDVSHGWDNPVLDGFYKTANNGQEITYIYSKDVTENTRERILEFLGQFK